MAIGAWGVRFSGGSQNLLRFVWRVWFAVRWRAHGSGRCSRELGRQREPGLRRSGGIPSTKDALRGGLSPRASFVAAPLTCPGLWLERPVGPSRQRRLWRREGAQRKGCAGDLYQMQRRRLRRAPRIWQPPHARFAGEEAEASPLATETRFKEGLRGDLLPGVSLIAARCRSDPRLRSRSPLGCPERSHEAKDAWAHTRGRGRSLLFEHRGWPLCFNLGGQPAVARRKVSVGGTSPTGRFLKDASRSTCLRKRRHATPHSVAFHLFHFLCLFTLFPKPCRFFRPFPFFHLFPF